MVHEGILGGMLGYFGLYARVFLVICELFWDYVQFLAIFYFTKMLTLHYINYLHRIIWRRTNSTFHILFHTNYFLSVYIILISI